MAMLFARMIFVSIISVCFLAASSLTFATFSSSCFNGFWIKAKALFRLRIFSAPAYCFRQRTLFLFFKKNDNL